MQENDYSFSIFLQDAYESRRKRNAKYSQRAFARDLGISPGWLSDIFAGRRVPGKKLTQRIIESLKLNPEESQKIYHLLDRHRLLSDESGGAYQLKEDQFAIIADRENFVLLNLLETQDFRSDISWMAERLNISKFAAQKVLDRLQRLGLITFENKTYKASHQNVTTSNEVHHEAIREHHRQILQYGVESLAIDDPEIRDITSMTLPVNLEKLEKAKELIRDFRRKLATLLEEGEKTEVYHLSIQLVPATKEVE